MIHCHFRNHVSSALGCALFAILFAMPAPTQEKSKTSSKEIERYSAFAFSQSGSFAGRSTNLTFIINSYSSEDEVHSLVGTLKKSGPEGLLKAIDDLNDKGRVAPIHGVGTGVEVIRQVPLGEGKRRITLLTGRNITIAENRSMSRSRDYPFGLIFLEVDAKGKGKGVMYAGCKIKFNKKAQIEIESYGIAPLKLTNVYLMD